MILITGATGNVGGELARRLHTHDGLQVRALTRDVARADLPAGVEVVQGDFTTPDSLDKALTGVSALFLMVSGPETGQVAARAAAAGVETIVLLSTMAVDTRPDSPIGRMHRQAEEAVEATGVRYTHLRPGQFASNTRSWQAQTATGDVIRTPFAHIALPAIHPGDIAAVAQAALTGPGHAGAAYQLTGPEAITPVQQVAALAAATGRPLRHEEITPEQAAHHLAAHMPPQIVAATLEFLGSPTDAETRALDTVHQVTGTPARPYAQWARDNAHLFR